ncbi:MAG: TRAP-type C4-dicarboxylate transport system permease small subunit [Paracoccaceae bacterium]|jgi:TRAP-type C4-dicarboxylate transport system permease small subunit
MVVRSSVHEDDSTLSRLDRRLYRIEGVLALISGLAIFGMVLLAVVSVTGRNAMNAPLPGYVDWIEQFMPLIAFMGIAYTQRDGGHIRMDILIGQLNGRALWLAELITTILMLILMLLLVWGSWAHFQRSFDFSSLLWSRDSSMDISIPLWPAKLLAPVAFSVLCLRLVLQIWGYGRAVVLGLDAPVAVPLIQDAAEQAMAEAETLERQEPTNGHD